MRVTKINHIGIAVQDIETTAMVYQVIGLSVSKVVDVPEQGARVAFIPVGDTTIELVQPTSQDSPIATHLAKRGEGMHHLALQVDDLAAALQEVQDCGLQLIDETPRQGAEGLIAFLHPRSTGRVLIELVEALPPGGGD